MNPTPSPTSSVMGSIERIRKCLDATLTHLDQPEADLGSSPLINLDVSTEHPVVDNLAPESAGALRNAVDDVAQLLVSLALRYQEQVALLTTTHTSALLKHQVESRRMQEKLSQDQKLAISLQESLKHSAAENALLQDQLRQEQLTSSAKIDVLHQKIVHLETSLHSAQKKLANVDNQSTASTPPPRPDTASSGTPTLKTSSETTSEQTREGDDEPSSLERDLRIATDLMSTERERAEKSEADLRRAQADLDRLKQHLIKVQDESDEKELELREEIDRLVSERDAFLSNGIYPSAASSVSNGELQKLAEELQENLENAKAQLLELESEVEESRTREMSLATENANLEASLVQLQADQQSELELHTVSLRNQVTSLKDHISRTEAQLLESDEKLKSATKALETVEELQQQVEEESSLREAIEYENEGLRTALQDAAARLGAATEGRDALIAKPLVAKIFSTYLHPSTTASSKSELLHLMANILEFTDDERRPLGIPLIKPAENASSSNTPATPQSHGLVSRVANATGNVLTGSITKSKQWLSWGLGRYRNNNASNGEPPNASTATSESTSTPSLADMWVKILMEGSETAKGPEKSSSHDTNAKETKNSFSNQANPASSTSHATVSSHHSISNQDPPSEAFKAPYPLPMIAPAPLVYQPPSQHAQIPGPAPTSSASAPSTVAPASIFASPAPYGAPMTPLAAQNANTRFSSGYAPAPRPEPSQSPYLAQQQAMRSAFQSQPKADAQFKPTS